MCSRWFHLRRPLARRATVVEFCGLVLWHILLFGGSLLHSFSCNARGFAVSQSLDQVAAIGRVGFAQKKGLGVFLTSKTPLFLCETRPDPFFGQSRSLSTPCLPI